MNPNSVGETSEATKYEENNLNAVMVGESSRQKRNEVMTDHDYFPQPTKRKKTTKPDDLYKETINILMDIRNTLHVELENLNTTLDRNLRAILAVLTSQNKK